MENKKMRIQSITIENFKNVQNGTLDLENKRKQYKASVTGIYGQNGSGKTAVIDALNILKYVLSGRAVPEKYADYIYIDALYSTLSFQFSMSDGDDLYTIWYRFRIREVVETEFGIVDATEATRIKVEVFDEVLEYSFTSKTEKIRKNVLIDTGTEEIFLPKSKFDELIDVKKVGINDLMVVKKLALAQSRSFIFSRELNNYFKECCENSRYLEILGKMILFGYGELFVIDTELSGLISMQSLPLSFKYKEGRSETVGYMTFPLNGPASIPEDAYQLVKKIIDNMNIVLRQLVPGLAISLVDMGPILMHDGKTGRQLQLASLKNDKPIPFRYESEGIKKIVSVLQLLIVIYNNSSITVAIDELDNGIFEYLLGEILNIISEKGKGQLLFTSHNLRPLETLDKGFIAFTTTDPKDRYYRMTNVKEHNNLRDLYYRDIVLGEKHEHLYNSTNNFEIAMAFREAGEAFGG